MSRSRVNIQFSLRAVLWCFAIASVILAAWRANPFWAVAIGLTVGGGVVILADCLAETESRVGASQLLVGAVVTACACGLMFAAAYAQWVSQRSGTLDYVTFSVGLFAFCYGLWVRFTASTPVRWSTILGYFAFVSGTFMLNHVLFDTVIRHLR